MMYKVTVTSVLAIAFIFLVQASSSFNSSAKAAQIGIASYYKSGRVTANGEAFNPKGYTAAHRSLPFGTKVRVRNLETGRSVVVRINDRGPFIRGRIIDLAYGAARSVGLDGIAKVSVEILK
ncbi:MAG TPA: septal ring lytic transglycosylase RlpA family protein [Aestuariivirgaceae bacterium]|nr:septal ring lytic transglycosylase RlpA family protein [Aestuariivirgaceae bacterium]